MEGMWRNLMKIIGREDFIGKEGFVTDLERFENRDQIDPLVKEWFLQHTVEEVVETMEKHRIPCGVYHSTAEIASDPHVQARRMLEYSDLGVPGLEKVPICGIPIRLTATPGSVDENAPAVGQHNDQYYTEMLGYDDAKLKALQEAGHI